MLMSLAGSSSSFHFIMSGRLRLHDSRFTLRAFCTLVDHVGSPFSANKKKASLETLISGRKGDGVDNRGLMYRQTKRGGEDRNRFGDTYFLPCKDRCELGLKLYADEFAPSNRTSSSSLAHESHWAER